MRGRLRLCAQVHGAIVMQLDTNNNNALDEHDFKHIAARGLAMLADGVPSMGGFLAGGGAVPGVPPGEPPGVPSAPS